MGDEIARPGGDRVPDGFVVLNTEAQVDVDTLHAGILALAPGPAVPWFLDVDGVLNVEAVTPGGPAGWPSYRQTMVSTSRDPQVPFVWSPDLADCLNLLVARQQVQVHWLTSWDSDAPRCAAPAIGLRVGQQVARDKTDDDERCRTDWWKLRILQSFASTCDFSIWTDDYIDEAALAGGSQALPSANVLAVCPDHTRGLLPEHLVLIIAAIADRRAWQTAVPPNA